MEGNKTKGIVKEKQTSWNEQVKKKNLWWRKASLSADAIQIKMS